MDASGAQDEGAAGGRRSRGVLIPRRWCQLATMLRIARGRRQQARLSGETTKETVKTIARGMPGETGATVVTNSCVLFFTHEAAGATGARHSLRPLQEGPKVARAKLARVTRRDGGGVAFPRVVAQLSAYPSPLRGGSASNVSRGGGIPP